MVGGRGKSLDHRRTVVASGKRSGSWRTMASAEYVTPRRSWTRAAAMIERL